jgi:hypothetical protein
MARTLANIHQRPHQTRMIGRRVSADQEEQVRILHILQVEGCRTRSKGCGQADATGLVAVEGAVVEKVGAIKAGKQLKQKAGLIRGSPAGVEKVLVRPDRSQQSGNALKGLVPAVDQSFANWSSILFNTSLSLG